MTPAVRFCQFGKYEIISKLGRSMTDVYLALDPAENRRVVLKIVEQFRDSYTQLVVEAERRGAMIQQQLHAMDPRILEVYEFGEQSGCFFVAMQYAEGRSLADLIRKEGRLDAACAARYGIEICSQLTTLHAFQADIDGQRRAVVHGDVKPANIQIGPDGQVWLLDFGIAKAITATRNLTQHNLGSPAYCSPERLKNSNVDPFADLWALGVTLYEMVSGIPPYQAQTTRKLENLIQSRRPPRALPEDCPAPLKAIVSKALAADSSRRYATAAALEQDLRLFLDRKPLAVASREPAWDVNATVEKPRAARAAPSVEARKWPRWLTDFKLIGGSLIAGLVIGLLCFLPASHFYRYWMSSAPLRAGRDYRQASVAAIESDWRLYKQLENTNSYLGGFSPVAGIASSLKQRLVVAGDDVLSAYRDSTDGNVSRFEWSKAKLCFQHALELDPAASELKGKIALCDGYLQLASSLPGSALERFQTAAGLLPKSPDPHLALARVYVYGLHNAGLASAEFHAAESAGYKIAPREAEQSADAYLYRAEQELKQWQQAKSAADQRRYLTWMERDFERARALYEPISGFSKVSQNLERLESDRTSVERIRATRERARLLALRSRSRYSRYHRRWR